MWGSSRFITTPAERPGWQRLIVAFTSLALAFAVASIETDLPAWPGFYPMLLAAILVSAWIGGQTSGFVATAVAIAGSLWLWRAKADPLEPVSLGHEIFGLALFGALAVLVSGICGHLHTAVRHARGASKEATRQFEIMANHAPVLIWISDVAGRCVFVNEAWKTFTGRNWLPGADEGWLADMHPDDRAAGEAEHAAKVGALSSYQREYRLRRADGVYCWLLERGVPRYNAQGVFAGYIGSCLDITDVHRERAELRLQQRLQAKLASSLELTDVADALVRGLVPEVADAAWLDLVDEENVTRCVRGVVADQDTEALLRPPENPGATEDRGQVLAAVVKTGAAHLAQPETGLVRSSLAVPLRARGRILGVLSLATRAQGRVLARSELAFVEKIAASAGFALDNARLYEDARRAHAAETNARRALEESERRMRSIWDANLVGLCFGRADGHVVDANDAYLQLLGHTRADLAEGRVSWRANIAPEHDQTMSVPGTNGTEAGSGRRVYEREYRRADGIRVAALVFSAVDQTGDGLAVILDLTARKAAERALARQQGLLNAVVNGVPALLCYLDPTGRHLVHNDHYATWFNSKGRQLAGKSLREVLGESLHARFAPHFETALHEGEVCSEETFAREDGRLRHLLATFSPDRDATGAVRGVVLHAVDITDRREIELALIRSEERYRTLATATATIVWTAEPGFGIVEASGWEEFTGQAWRDYKGEGWTEQVHPADRSMLTQLWSPHGAGARPREVECRLRTRDRTYRHVRARAVPLLDNDGVVREWIGTIADIHDHKRAEESLRRTESELQVIIDAMPALVSYVGRDFRYGLANATYRTWFGTDPAALRGHTVESIIGVEAFEVVRPAIERALKGEVVRFDQLLAYKTGGTRWVDVHYTPHVDEDGNVLGCVALVQDISERKHFDTELADALARFRFLAEAMPQIVWTTRPDGSLDYINDRWMGLTGMNVFRSHGYQWTEALLPEDSPRTLLHWQDAVREGRPFEIEHRIFSVQDNRHRWHLTRAHPRRDETGTVVQWIGYSTDIDEQRRAFAELAEARERLSRHAEELEVRVHERTVTLREANAELEAFTYSVSHDLRAPLQFVHGYADAINDDPQNQLTTDSRDHLQRVMRAATRMERIIQDLLNYSRVSRAEIRLAEVPLQDVMADVLMHHQAILKAAAARVSVPADLPVVRADPTGLFQVLSNLISNAVKFTPAGQPPQISITAERRAEGVRLIVADQGIGIDTRYHERIFKLFERLHGVSEYPGTGIGLSLVRKAMQRMGGTCGVESGPGQGSRFWIQFSREGSGVVASQAGG